MSRQKRQPIANEFFDKTEKQSIGFEITLAALLATACLSFPVPNHTLSGQIIAFTLLGTTLFRRVVSDSPFAPKELLQKTVPMIEVATTSAVIYLLASVNSEIKLPFLSGSLPLQFILLGTIFVTFAVILQEYFLHDYLIWWHAKFSQMHSEDQVFAGLWKDVSLISYWGSRARRHRESYKEIGRRISGRLPEPDDMDFSRKEILNYTFRSLIVLGLFALIPSIYGYATTGWVGILVVPIAITIHDQSCFWYIAYGNVSYEDFRKPMYWIIFWTCLYVTETGVFLGVFKSPL